MRMRESYSAIEKERKWRVVRKGRKERERERERER